MSLVNNRTLHIQSNILQAKKELVSLGFLEAEIDLEIIIESIFNSPFQRCIKSKTYFSKTQFNLFWKMVSKRKKFWPLSYITKTKMFFNNQYTIPYKVFIPRPETEQLVEKGIALIKQHNPDNIIDIGCGSGVISCEIALKFPKKKIWSFDISKKAIQATQLNASNLKINNITTISESFEKSDLLSKLLNEKTFIISNPPYIALNEKKVMDKEVILFEPQKALYASNNGLSIIEKILNFSFKENTPCLLEIGYRQSETLKKIFPGKLKFFCDYNNIKRFCYYNVNLSD